MQLAYYLYTSTNRYTVFAFKGRFGTTARWGDLNSTYVPFERHFYCGGANSVRGWSARRLRYTDLTAEDLGSDEIYTFSQDYMGNATIIEGTAELRYRFQRTGKLGDFWDEQISSMGMSAFIDIGNAFDWYVDTKTVMKPEYYLTKLGISAGAGFRYETPVGPFRIDFAWPIYDPTDKLNPWAMDKVFFRDFVFHIAIGNSF
jgi:outer membrane protein assembly factor BamA